MTAWVMALLWLAMAIQGGSSQGNVATKAPTAEIGFELHRGFLVIVPASVNGIRELSFVVDTGSGRTIIDKRLAKRLNLAGSPVHLAAVNTSIALPESVAANFEVGPVRIDSVPVLLRDMGFLQKLMGRRIDGILGLDVLARQTFSLDYQSRKLLLGDCLEGEFHVPLAPATSLLAVPVEVQGKWISLLLDTGASDIQLFAKKAAVSSPIATRKAYGLAGDFRVAEVRVAPLRMGRDELSTRRAFVVDGQTADTQDFDGLLSPVALGIRHMCVDVHRGEFSWGR